MGAPSKRIKRIMNRLITGTSAAILVFAPAVVIAQEATPQAVPQTTVPQGATPPVVVVPQTPSPPPKIVPSAKPKTAVIVPSAIVPAQEANRAVAAKVDAPPSSGQAQQVLGGPVAAPVEPAAEKALTLEESIVIALSNHGDISAAQLGFAGSLERITAARAGGAPQLGIESGYANRSIANAGGSNNISNRDTTSSIVLSQNIFDSGLRGAQTRVARANAGASLAGVGQARSQVAFNVATAFFQQLRQERLVELAQQQIKVAQDNLALVRGQIEAEVAAKVDEIPIQVELRQRQFNLSAAQNDLRTAQVNFRNALGLGRGPVLQIQNVSADVPPVGAIDEYFAQAQKLNPDLRISQANLESAAASVDVAKIQAKPRVSVDVSLAAGLFDSPRRQSGLTAGLNVPIFNGGALKANRRAAQDTLEATRLRDEQLAKDIAADLESAYKTVQSANERIGEARALEEVAVSSLQVAQEKYRQGLGTPYEITVAQLQLFNAQISTVQALYDYYLAQAALERATGARSGLNPPAGAATTNVPVVNGEGAPANP